jgi:hypothetical protein
LYVSGVRLRGLNSFGIAHCRHLDAARAVHALIASRHVRECEPAFVANLLRDGRIVYARAPLPEPPTALKRSLTTPCCRRCRAATRCRLVARSAHAVARCSGPCYNQRWISSKSVNVVRAAARLLPTPSMFRLQHAPAHAA